MPVIPTYHEQVNAAGAINSPQASGNDFGAGVARAQGQFADVVGELADHMAKVHNQTMLHAASAQASTDLNTFSQTLENGSTDAQGNYVPPPPVQDHEKLFADKVKQIHANAKATLPGRLYDQLAPQIDGDVGTAYVQMRKNSIAKAKDASLSTIDQTVESRAREAAGLSGVQRETSVAKGVAAINLAEQGGLIDKVERDKRVTKFGHDIDMSDLIRDQRDPDAALRNLQDPKAYPGLTAQERERAVTQTLGFKERDDRAALAREEHQIRVQRQAQIAVQRETSKSLVDADVAGKLTPQLVQANADRLSAPDYRYFLDKAAGKSGSQKSVPTIVIGLREQQQDGKDVSDQAGKEFAAGRLTHDDYMTFTKPEGEEPWRKRPIFKDGMRAINTAFSVGAFGKAEDRIVHENVQNMWIDWFRNNPEATPKEANEEKVRLIKTQSKINFDTNISVITPPKLMAGGRSAMYDRAAVQKAYSETVKAMDDKSMEKPQALEDIKTFQRVLMLLDQQNAAMEPKEAQPK